MAALPHCPARNLHELGQPTLKLADSLSRSRNFITSRGLFVVVAVVVVIVQSFVSFFSNHQCIHSTKTKMFPGDGLEGRMYLA